MLPESESFSQTRWAQNCEPKHISFSAHESSVITCLLFFRGRIISASDDASIHIYSPITGRLLRTLDGHQGGVWALSATGDTLVSGSSDHIVRIWNIETGRCLHIFGGHTSTVRCLAIVKPEWIDVETEESLVSTEKWPKRPLIVTGGRDHSLRVWTLPRSNEPEYRSFITDKVDMGDPEAKGTSGNPYHRLFLEGHKHAVRALSARGRTMVSGSYDCTLRVWDIVTGKCRWIIHGHTQKVYSVLLDMPRHQAYSGSMDDTVRIWSLQTGECLHKLTDHTSLVGLLGLSSSTLVSASADSTLRVWDPDTGELRYTFAAHTGAITCFQHNEFKVLSGSDGALKLWDIRDGKFIRNLLTDVLGVWQVVFKGRWCVAAINRSEMTMIDVWDFGTEADEIWTGEDSEGTYDDETSDEE